MRFSGFRYIVALLIAVVLGMVGFSGGVASGNTAGWAIAQTLSELPPAAVPMRSYRSPTCSCCGRWVEHMQDAGFQVDDRIAEDMEAVKQELGVPTDLASCHTAVVGGYVIEGHVPATDVQRLLAERPNVAGLAAPGMPVGSPGMETGDTAQPYTIYSFTAAGDVAVFQEHSS